MKKDSLSLARHSCSHLLAAAVLNLYPDTKLGIGPATDSGFYYDFLFKEKLSEDDLPKIEKEMHKILSSWSGFERLEKTISEAEKIEKDQPLKLELILEFSKTSDKVSFYKSGGFLDLCKGGHVENIKEIGFFKLMSLAGAYWRGNEKNQMLTRIYGTCFPTKENLDNFLKNIDLAKQRDHRKIAAEMDLIVFSDIVGSGLPLYTPKGAVLRKQIYDFSRKLNTQIGYEETALPSLNKAKLFKISGHYDKYKNDMFEVKSHYSKDEFFLKPMNCPQHCIIYASKPRSYRDLPIRYSDFSVLYRDEQPGEIHGLFRSRAFTQDDGHCFARQDQIEEEFLRIISVVDQALKAYGFSYSVRLSLRDPGHKEKYLGSDAVWEKSEKILKTLVKQKNLEFQEAPGEAAIYGPKLDYMATDSLGRKWQLSTIQLDLNMPERFGLSYTDMNGKQQIPVLIHRAIVGSERFIAILIEHFAGKFPLWLSPIQTVLIPIADRHINKSQEALDILKKHDLRAILDDKKDTLQAKIRRWTLQKVPYLCIIGDKEIENVTNKDNISDKFLLSVRNRNGENKGTLSLNSFIHILEQEVDKKV